MVYNRLLLLFAVSAISLISNAQIPGWSYFKVIAVQENSGDTLSDYQLKLTFDSQTLIAAGQMNADGSDIRFTDTCNGGNFLNYWIESAINTDTTVIWVKIPSLAANQSENYFMHYGNSSATAVSAVNGTFFGPQSATDSVSGASNGGVGSSQRGFRFSPTEDILLTSLGKNEPTGTPRTITVFDFATQAILCQGVTSGPAAQYSYNDISQPLWLTTGTQYLCEIYQDVSDGYYFGAAGQIGQHLTYLDMRYCNSCAANTFPTNSLNNIHYGYVDFWYYTKNNVSPAPTYQFFSGQLDIDVTAQTGICYGDTVQLSGVINAGVTPFVYSWTGSNLQTTDSQYVTATPAQGGYYILQVQDACGTLTSDSVEVMVNALPVLAVVSSDSLACNGDMLVLTVSGADTYLWNDGSSADTLVVAPAVTTTYSVTGTDVNGCVSQYDYSQVINVPINGSQTLTICANSSLIYNGHTYTTSGTYTDTIAGISGCDSIVTTNLTILPAINTTLTDTNMVYYAPANADSYQWIDCNAGQPVSGETSNVFSPSANGSYAVVIGVGACSDTSQCFTVSNLGINELAWNTVSVYPNPGAGLFNIRVTEDMVLNIVDRTGRNLGTVNVKANEINQLNLQQYPAGIYMLSNEKVKVNLVITK